MIVDGVLSVIFMSQFGGVMVIDSAFWVTLSSELREGCDC